MHVMSLDKGNLSRARDRKACKKDMNCRSCLV